MEKKLLPDLKSLPYNPFRTSLYTWQELMEGYTMDKDASVDLGIYTHFSANKYAPKLEEALAQRIHDHAIDDALRRLLQFSEDGMTKKRCVGIMGGHSALRTSDAYRSVAQTARLLAIEGYFITSGGGPGIMEAANLGAYLSQYSANVLNSAIDYLCIAPKYTDSKFIQTAKDILEKHPNGTESLAIPTWFYGHEPSNLFATQIAKYFSNSIREDTLLAISLYGVIYAQGSAGTTQEIFMDATQNHYGTFGYYSPMVFMGRKRYEIDTLIYPLLRQLAYSKKYYDMLFLTDLPSEVVGFIKNNPPEKV